MPHVGALYRYPVKGFTPEACDFLWILPNGRVAGDRVIGIRFANTDAPDDCWSRKTGMLALVNTPGLARLRLRIDTTKLQLCIEHNGATLVDARLDDEGRKAIGGAVARHVLGLEENPLRGHPERLPLRVVGDGVTPRYHDSEAGQVTLHGRGSLRALAAALGKVEVNELRFRSNIAIDGLSAWEEQGWVGRKIRIGTVEFDVTRPKLRCLATHANPQTGQRDLPVLTTLTTAFNQQKPTFAVAMVPVNGPGEIRVGDEVMVSEG